MIVLDKRTALSVLLYRVSCAMAGKDPIRSPISGDSSFERGEDVQVIDVYRRKTRG